MIFVTVLQSDRCYYKSRNTVMLNILIYSKGEHDYFKKKRKESE